jgi:PadR family transcriptional regulator AphA
MSSGERELTTTSYAILGLLAVRSWSTYELARQMRRNFHYFWPRAESNLYAEPKRLVAGGFARSRTEHVGRRPRTHYSITTKGRVALERWLREPASASRLESEAIIKILFSPFGTRADLLGHLRGFQDEAEATRQALRGIFDEYLHERDPFPERVQINVLCYRLLWDSATAAASWAAWAIEQVEHWDEASPGERESSMAILRDAIQHDKLLRPGQKGSKVPGRVQKLSG